MSQTRNRWLINVILVLAVIAFVGFSMIPLIDAAFKQGKPLAGATPTASEAATGQSKLEDQARGYELVLQREPDNQTALRGLLEAKLQLKDFKSAIAPLEKLAALNPNRTEYTVLLGQFKQYAGDPEGAAQAYRSILQSKPGDIEALQGLVGLLLQQKRPEAAIGMLQDTLKTASQANQIQPGSVDVASVQLLLGRVYATEKRYDEAISTYDHVIKTDKQDFRPVLGKAIVLKEQGKTEQAKPLFQDAVALAPAQYKDQINQMAAQPSVASTTPATPPASTTTNKSADKSTTRPTVPSSATTDKEDKN